MGFISLDNFPVYGLWTIGACCDYTWTGRSGFGYLGIGGYVDNKYIPHSGISALFSNRNSFFVHWDIGASYCDHMWNRGYPCMYCMVGPAVHYMYDECGMYCCAIYHGPSVDGWTIGACDSLLGSEVSGIFIFICGDAYSSQKVGCLELAEVFFGVRTGVGACIVIR